MEIQDAPELTAKFLVTEGAMSPCCNGARGVTAFYFLLSDIINMLTLWSYLCGFP